MKIVAPPTVFIADTTPLAYTEPKYTIKLSSIPNAGDGLFAAETIQPDQVIFEYSGPIAECATLTPEEVAVSLNVKHDLCIVGRSTASKINDTFAYGPLSDDEVRELILEEKYRVLYDPTDKPLLPNCVFVVCGEGVFARGYVKTITQIEPGDELFIAYGPLYWLHHLLEQNLVSADVVAEARTELRRKMLDF